MAASVWLKVYTQINGSIELCTDLKLSDVFDQFWVQHFKQG